MFNYKQNLLIASLWFTILLVGCSSIGTHQYPDVIYNHRQPLVSVSYEYGEIDIQIPLVFPGIVPEQLSFQVYARGDSINPLITIKSNATDLVRIFLPQGVLDIEENNNFILIKPHHPDFVSKKVMFKGIDYGKVTLDPVHIVQQPLTIAGLVSNTLTEKVLNNIDVSLFLKNDLLQKVFSNENGEYTLTISGEYKNQDFLRIIAGEKLIFSPFRRDISFEKTKELRLDIGLGPSQELADLGNLYITNKSNVHFRDKPHIGGATLFLLPEGEPIAVEQVSKGLYYGTIEILVSSGKRVKMSGWLERQFTDLLFLNNIFKDEKVYEQTL